METLHDVVKAGKVRYLGASSMSAWQFAKLQHVAQLHGWTPFVALDVHLTAEEISVLEEPYTTQDNYWW